MPGRARFLTLLGWALLTGVALVAAVGAERVAGSGMPDAAGDLLAGLALVTGGAAAWAMAHCCSIDGSSGRCRDATRCRH